jgi:hypothetical protein
MDADDFRRIAHSLEGAEESSHLGHPDCRVGGRIFATLAWQGRGYGNPKLMAEQPATFVGKLPEVFVPVAGGWGRMGMTHIRLAVADEDVLAGALRTADCYKKILTVTSGFGSEAQPRAPIFLVNLRSTSRIVAQSPLLVGTVS